MRVRCRVRTRQPAAAAFASVRAHTAQALRCPAPCVLGPGLALALALALADCWYTHGAAHSNAPGELLQVSDSELTIAMETLDPQHSGTVSLEALLASRSSPLSPPRRFAATSATVPLPAPAPAPAPAPVPAPAPAPAPAPVACACRSVRPYALSSGVTRSRRQAHWRGEAFGELPKVTPAVSGHATVDQALQWGGAAHGAASLLCALAMGGFDLFAARDPFKFCGDVVFAGTGERLLPF